MGPSCKIVCLCILGLYIPFQLVDTFYFNLDNDQNDERPQGFFGPFIDIDRPMRIDPDNEPGDEATVSHENDMADFFPPSTNLTERPDLPLLQERGLGCNEVREERYRCCRVYDQMIEAWWCPERRPFCCHQGTFCAVCCTLDELRRSDVGPAPASCRQDRPRTSDIEPRHRPPPPDQVVDGTWFWSGLKAAWLAMFAVLLASLLCTCLAYRCIRYLVAVINDEDSDLEEEYLAYHFDSLGLVSAEDRQSAAAAARQAALPHGLLPPKYSDINFIPVQPEAGVRTAVAGEPPPQYSSEPETETETEPPPQTETETETRTEAARPTSAPPPPAGQL